MSAATNDSTRETPHFVGKHACKHKAWLIEDARQHVTDTLTSPPLDCADLAERMRTNSDVAYADLTRLDLVQLTLQAVCYAAYANELLGLDVSGEEVLAFWCVALTRRGLEKEAA